MILVVDSATEACSVALIENERLIDERHEIVGRGHAERLVPMIADLLAGRKPSGILVDCGPGSFTGVRVGLAAAHGLAIGWSVPVLGYSSTAILAIEARQDEVLVAMHAGHGEIFVQTYRDDPFRAIDALQSLTPAAAASLPTRYVVGSGAEVLVGERGSGRAMTAVPRAAAARLLPQELRSRAATPIYGRAPDAKPPA